MPERPPARFARFLPPGFHPACPGAGSLAHLLDPLERAAMLHWHALMTKPRREAQVAGALEARGIEVFAPLLEYTGRSGRPLDKPFFPRYIFARFDWARTGFGSVQWTPGLSEVVRFDGQPAWLADEAVAFLRRRIEGIDGDAFLRLKPGAPVRVKSGPFRDYDAIFDKHLNGEGRVSILLDILGRRTRVQLDQGDLDRLGAR